MAKVSLNSAQFDTSAHTARTPEKQHTATLTAKPQASANAVLAFALSLILAISFLPLPAFARTEIAPPPKPTTAHIQDMLLDKDYVEGELIVVAESGARLPSDKPAEEIVQVSNQAMELTAQATQESPVEANVVAAQRADLSSAGHYQVTLISSSYKTTEQLLIEAFDTPGVISAQPNYIVAASETYAEDANPATSAANPAADTTNLIAGTSTFGQSPLHSTLPIGEHEPNPENLSALQWYLDSGGGTNTLEGDGSLVAGMDLPGYAGGGVGTLNSSLDATVAVLDSGMDVTNPDLQDVFYTFTPEQQAAWGCGEHGYNATVERGTKGNGNLADVVGHGTHVCGIVAAAWDGKGTAGVANGAKLIGVRLSGDNGAQTAASNIRAFGFLTDIARDVNLKAVNCSWGSDLGTSEFTYTLLVNQLGEQGVITVFAAGNDEADTDQLISTGDYIDSPYVLSVDAMTPAATKAFFSNYGITRTDVFAPGTSVLSTVPDFIADHTNRAFRFYYAESEQGLIARERFESGTAKGVMVFSENPVDVPSAQDVAGMAAVGTNDTHSLSIARSAFKPAPRPEISDDLIHYPDSRVYMKIPVGTSDGSDIGYVSFRHSSDFGKFSYTATLYGFVGKTSQGSTKIVDISKDDDGCFYSANSRAYKSNWANATLNVEHLLKADTEAQSIYVDENGCITVIVGIQELRVDGGMLDTLYVDDIAVGSTDAHPSSHEIYNGTSMAAPAVTGAMAIVAKDEPLNSSLAPGTELGMQALERSARLRAATVNTADLDPYCATGGYVRLTSFKEMSSTEDAPLAPIIVSGECANNRVVADGYFFGDTSGVADVDGQHVSVVSWNDGQVCVNLPADIQNGSHVLTLKTAAGQDRIAFSYSESGAGTPMLYEETLPVPNMNTVDNPDGNASFTSNLCASGDNLYILQKDLNNQLTSLWKYNITDQEWSVCKDLPTEDAGGRGTVLAATENGVVFYTNVRTEDGGSESKLFDYDVATDSWSERQISSHIPDYAGVFSRGNDIYFAGGGFHGEQDPRDVALSVLREGASEVEILGSMPPEVKGHESYLTWPVVAASDRYIYLAGTEPLGGVYDYPWGLIRIKLDENDHMIETKLFTSELVDADIIDPTIRSSIALAGMPCGAAIIGRVTHSSDTRTMKSGSDDFTVLDRTSTYYVNSGQAAVYHNGKLYVLGFSPSEPNLMYFRATALDSDHVWDEGVVVKEPSATEPGEKLFTCSACGHTKTEEIAPLGPVVYSFVEGDTDDQGTQPSQPSWTKGLSDTLAFQLVRNRDNSETFTHFTALMVDGVVLPESAYSAQSGSEGGMIIKLLPAFLETLAVGEHSIRAVFDDGEAQTLFTVKAANVNPSPDPAKGPGTPSAAGAAKTPGTGDVLYVGGMLAAVIAAGAALVVFALRRRV